MAHKSRLSTLVIDCQTQDLTEAKEFWSAVFGSEAKTVDDGRYVELDGHTGYPKMLLQAVDHSPRVHIDIETDDQEAECARLKSIGAKELYRIKSFIVMEAPTGHRFCIVRPQNSDFPGKAKNFP